MINASISRSDLRKKLKACVTGKVLFDEPLSRHTSWKVGGPAEILFFPDSPEDLRNALSWAQDQGIAVTVLGNGSNVLISDRGLSGLTVQLKEINRIEVEGNQITAGAGATLPDLSRIACTKGLSGLEFAGGIPATLGGAVAGNAGAHGSCMGDVVTSVTVMDYQGVCKDFDREELDFGYRTSRFKGGTAIVLEARMLLTPGSIEGIRREMNQYLEFRSEKQPTGIPTTGSVFVNPEEEPAGYLIEKAGLKGKKEGGAQVSEKHANFILNIDNATAKDIYVLIREIQETVCERFGISLNTEIRFLGELP